MEKSEMQFPLKAVTFAVSLFLSGSVSSQDQLKSATSDSHYRLNRSLSYDLDGIKILVLSASQNASCTKRGNMIWNALEAEGVGVTFVRGKLSKYKLNAFDQLWIFSSSQYDARVLTQRDFQAINQFARSRKGLYLLSDAASEDIIPNIRPPTRRIGYATFEADAIAGELFQAKVHGSYAGQQVLKFTDSAPSHPLLTSVRTLYEGTTISHISCTEQLDVIVSASDSSPLIAVAKSKRLNVVLDCGFTRYHPKSTDDSVQLAINIARYLDRNVQR